jgi:hypothetical protein
MARVTLSIPDDIYVDMKRFPEIKWSEIVRRTIVSYLEEMKEKSSPNEIRRQLSSETISRLKAISANKGAKYYRRAAKEEWMRREMCRNHFADYCNR